MRLVRHYLGLLCAVACAAFASLGRAQTADDPRCEAPSPAALTTARPAYPLNIRIDQAALDRSAARKVDERGRVDRLVLGTHAVGDSRTQAAVSVCMVPDRDGASLDVYFKGHTHTRTVGANGPALIYSHTDTDFVCTRRISFDPRHGFVAVASTVVADTKLTFDGFGSSRGGLGHRLVSRIASRRAGELHEQARKIAARDNERELLQAFDKAVNARLVSMNQELKLVRYANRIMGDTFGVQLAARSSKDCIHIGFGYEGSPARLTSIPTLQEAVAPIEVFVHFTIFGGRLANLSLLAESQQKWPQLSRLEFLRTLAMQLKESARIVDVAAYDGWYALGLQQDTLATSAAPIRPSGTSGTPNAVKTLARN